LKIEDRRTFRVVPLALNPVQRRLHLVVERQRAAGRPVRVLILKSRRMGVSTYIQGRFTHTACVTKTFHGLTGTHRDDSSTYLHGMSERMIDNLPEALQPPKKSGIQGKRIEFKHGSSLRTFTAGSGEGVGRGTGTNALHLSEKAYWRDQRGTSTALMQLVPDEPDTWVFVESTANGMGDMFHAECELALNGQGDYEFVFAAWFEFPDYRLDDERTEITLGKAAEWVARESALILRGVDRNQLAWRRWAITNLCGGDSAVFDQEYPDSPEVAFLTSGRPYFAHEQLEAFHPVAPSRIGSVEGEPIRGGSSLAFHANQAGPLRIWSTPKPGREYIVFADVAGKVTGDQHDARPVDSKADHCAASVVDRETGEQVAAYHAHIDPDLYGYELARIGWLYRGAMVAVENTGGYGTATIATLYRLLAYPNLYTHRRLDTTSQKYSDEIGWDTTESTRPLMLAGLRSMLRDHPDRLKDEGLKREMRSFVVHSNGKPAGASGTHDDRVMAHAGALEVWREHAQRPLRVAAKPKKQTRSTGSLASRAPRITA
jgi:hypothetical protein